MVSSFSSVGSQVLRALGATTSMTALALSTGRLDERRSRQIECHCNLDSVSHLPSTTSESRVVTHDPNEHCSASSVASKIRTTVPLALSPLQHDRNDEPPKLRLSPTKRRRTTVTNKETREYDYVIIGCGTAGKSALEALQLACPGASIAVLDPRHGPASISSLSKVNYIAERATRLDPPNQLVHFGNDKNNKAVSYKHALLVATGARGAPPPRYLMDESLEPDNPEKDGTLFLESRPTGLSTSSCSHESMEETRNHVLAKAAKGARIGFLGSGWEALELAVAAACNSNENRKKKGPPRVSLIFGNASPLQTYIPNYLNAALTKRLRSKRLLNIEDRTLVRYISTSSDPTKKVAQLYLAKSFDFLDSSHRELDLIVLIPDTLGHCGSAAIATDEVPPHLTQESTSPPLLSLLGPRSWYQTWANLSRHQAQNETHIVCYRDDGRVAVNSELQACSGVFAAGSVARYANSLTGHAAVASGVRAGQVAAHNMARLYPPNSSQQLWKSGISRQRGPKTMEMIPVFRSDLRSVRSRLGNNDETHRYAPTSLAHIGVSALAVGNCDSDRYSTHGIWWTNQATQKRLFNLPSQNNNDNSQENQRVKQLIKPVYGIGVVYYFDRSGKLQGIMTWGLPFADVENGDLNSQLVDHMRSMILSNGGIRTQDSELDEIRMSKFLVEESKRLVSISFRAHNKDKAGNSQTESSSQFSLLEGTDLQDLPRPLHRFTEVRPPNIRSLNVLKRNDGHGNGVLGQDLFDRYDECVEDSPVPKPDLTTNVGYAAQKAKAMYEWNVWEQKQKRWDENESRARPAREDSLWIRKGDELKKVSAKETLQAAYSNILFGKSR